MFLGNEYLPARMSWNYLKGRTKKQSNVSCIPSVSLIRGSLVTFRKGCQSFFANGFLPGTISECWNAYKSTSVTNLESSVLLNCTYYKPHCWTAKGWFTSNQSKPVYILKNPPPICFWHLISIFWELRLLASHCLFFTLQFTLCVVKCRDSKMLQLFKKNNAELISYLKRIIGRVKINLERPAFDLFCRMEMLHINAWILYIPFSCPCIKSKGFAQWNFKKIKCAHEFQLKAQKVLHVSTT